jgi:hypothetical protein
MWKSRLKEIAQEAALVGVAIVGLAIVKYLEVVKRQR